MLALDWVLVSRRLKKSKTWIQIYLTEKPCLLSALCHVVAHCTTKFGVVWYPAIENEFTLQCQWWCPVGGVGTRPVALVKDCWSLRYYSSRDIGPGGSKGGCWENPVWTCSGCYVSLKEGLAPRDIGRGWVRFLKHFAEMTAKRENFKHVVGSSYVTEPKRQWIGWKLGKKGINHSFKKLPLHSTTMQGGCHYSLYR